MPVQYMSRGKDTRLGRNAYMEVFGSAMEFVSTLDKRMSEKAIKLPTDNEKRYISLNPSVDFKACGGSVDGSWIATDCTDRSITDKGHPFRSWKEDKDAIIYGTDEDVEAIGLDKRIVLDRKTRTRLVRDYVGAFPCVPAHLGGSFRSMYRPVKVPLPQKTATFILLTNAPAFTSPDKLRIASRNNMAKVLDAERQGIRTNVYAGSYAVASTHWGDKSDLLNLVKLKDSSSVFSPKRLAWALASAGFLRIYQFNWRATNRNAPIPYGFGLPLVRGKCVGGSYESHLKAVFPAFFKSLGNFVVLSTMDELSRS